MRPRLSLDPMPSLIAARADALTAGVSRLEGLP